MFSFYSLKKWVSQLSLLSQIEGLGDSLLESRDDVLEIEIGIPGALTTPNGRRSAHGKTRKFGVKSTYNLRSRVVLEELVKFRKKELVEPMREAKKKYKYHKAYMG